jgi:HK97 family phage prohead protease
MQFKTLGMAQAEIKFAGDSPSFTGYASKFGGVDSYGDTILPGAYTKALAETGGVVKMYANHGWLRGELPIGLIHVSQDDAGLKVDGAEFTKGMRLADETALAVRHGTMAGLSIGYKVARSSYTTRADGGRDIKTIDVLKEISVVDYPADSAATIDEVKAAIEQADSLKEIESLLRDAGGFSRADACALVARVKSLAHGDRDAEAKRQMTGAIAAAVLQHLYIPR